MSNPPIYTSKYSPNQGLSPTRQSFTPNQISPSVNNLPTRSSSPFNRGLQASSVIETDLHDIQKSFEDETQEVQKRYNFIYEKYLRLGKTAQEFEQALEEERRKNALLQESFNAMAKDFDDQRKRCAQAENQILPLKDELKRKDAALADMDKQLGKYQQNNNLLANENNSLRAELAKVGTFYQGKLKELEDNYLPQLRDLKNRADAATNQLEQSKADHMNQLKQLDNDWREKCRNLENQLRNMDQHLNDLEHQCKLLMEENARAKATYDDQLRQAIAATRQDEENKWKALVDDLKQQMAKTLNDERYFWESRMHELENELALKNKQLQDLKGQRDVELQTALNENQQLRAQMVNLAAENDRLRKELQNKDQVLGKLDRDNQNMRRDLDGLKQNHVQDMNNILQAHENDKRDWGDHIRGLEQQIHDRDDKIKALEEQLVKFRIVFGSLKDQLVGNIAKAVDTTLTSSADIHKNR